MDPTENNQSQNESRIQKNLSPMVLITGGSGLIGRYLTSALLGEGYNVAHLSRKQEQFGKVRVFRWDPGKGILNKDYLEGIDYIIHLAGENIGDKRWSRKRKTEIIESRIRTAELLHGAVSASETKLKAYISASAIGYYGAITSENIFSETDIPANDFLGTTCRLWEESADAFSSLADRVVKIRTAVVLEKNDSALSKLLRPASFGVFPVVGGGKQYMPWIHIRDLVNIYMKAITDEKIKGSFNAVSPQHTTNREFMKTLSFVLNKPFMNFPVPGVILRIALGEMADVVIKGSRISCEKIIKAGYSFEFDNLPYALNDVLNK